jgi:hypothetical protein
MKRDPSGLGIMALGLGGLVVLYALQILAGYLPSIGLWFLDAIFYYCFCPALIVFLLVTWKEHGIRILSIFILLMASVCTFFQPTYLPFTRGFLSRMKSEVDPRQLQTWALNLISTRRAECEAMARSGIRHIAPKRDTPPEFIRKIRGYGHPMVGVGTHDGQWEVSLDYGGHFKGWGLSVGNIDLQLKSDQTLYVVQWAPGVFAVHTRGP